MKTVAAVLVLALVVTGVTRAAPAPDTEKPVSAFRIGRDPKVKHSIPLDRVIKGIQLADPRDRIRSIDRPRFTVAKEATWLRDRDRVLGIVVGKEAHAYPLRILDRHEIVNDRFGDRAVAATW